MPRHPSDKAAQRLDAAIPALLAATAAYPTEARSGEGWAAFLTRTLPRHIVIALAAVPGQELLGREEGTGNTRPKAGG